MASLRIEVIAGLLSGQKEAADVGTDHGYLPIYLVKECGYEHVVAMDLRRSPLERAMDNARQAGVFDRIDFRISDGLDAITKNEDFDIVLSGMGGFLIIDIIKRGVLNSAIKKGTELIISPHSDREDVRIFLKKEGFEILHEFTLYENEKYYSIIKCRYEEKIEIKTKELDSIFQRYGYYPIIEKQSALIRFLKEEKIKLNRVFEGLNNADTQKARIRKEQIKKDIIINQTAISMIESGFNKTK